VAARLALVSVVAAGATLAAAAIQPSPAAAYRLGPDWTHALQVIANLQASPPSTPVVLLFGGSSARESTIDDASWAAEIAYAGGPAVISYNLGTSIQHIADGIPMVQELPPGTTTPTLVFIGISLGRFTAPRSDPTITLPDPVDPLPAYQQHRSSETHILSVDAKRRLLKRWLTERYPVFQERYSYNLGVLERLIRLCLRRGLHPVMLDLPRDMAFIGHALDAPITRYHRGCRALAREYDVPFVNFIGSAQLVNRDFSDLWHLVEPGRVKWQALLSERTVQLLQRYGIGTTPIPDLSPLVDPGFAKWPSLLPDLTVRLLAMSGISTPATP
jgi:hypothetical protein